MSIQLNDIAIMLNIVRAAYAKSDIVTPENSVEIGQAFQRLNTAIVEEQKRVNEKHAKKTAAEQKSQASPGGA